MWAVRESDNEIIMKVWLSCSVLGPPAATCCTHLLLLVLCCNTPPLLEPGDVCRVAHTDDVQRLCLLLLLLLLRGVPIRLSRLLLLLLGAFWL